MANAYTPALLAQFDRLTNKLSSRDQMKRIEARCAVNAFVKEHGEEVCDAMFERLKRRDAKRNSKVRDA